MQGHTSMLSFQRIFNVSMSLSEHTGRAATPPKLRARQLPNTFLKPPPNQPLALCSRKQFESSECPPPLSPPPPSSSFTVRIGGNTYAFSCLPFGWQFSPLICQSVRAGLCPRIGPVIVLQYVDGFLVVGYGRLRVRSAAAILCEAWRKEAQHTTQQRAAGGCSHGHDGGNG